MNDPLFSLKDRVTLVSGGSRGIGKAIAQAMAERGARVIISSRTESTLAAAAEEIGSADRPVTPLVCDVSDSDAIRELVDRVRADFGRLDVLFNVAAVNKRGPIEDYTEADYDWIMNNNLKGAFLLAQTVGRQMIEQRAGKIVNIASVNSLAPLVGVGPYAMAKAALVHMTRSMAAEWGPHNVQVNALAPGFVLTDLTRKVWDDDTMRDWLMRQTPQRRAGEPRDMVGTAVFLASPASDWVTGQTIYVDGGWTSAYMWPILE
jgi:gluconate 5-dehydrogenase